MAINDVFDGKIFFVLFFWLKGCFIDTLISPFLDSFLFKFLKT